MSCSFCLLNFFLVSLLFVCCDSECQEGCQYSYHYHNQNHYWNSWGPRQRWSRHQKLDQNWRPRNEYRWYRDRNGELHCPAECYQKRRLTPEAESTTAPQQAQPLEQCPCVKLPGSTKCLSYDTRIQAASIDEALYKFPDLSSYGMENQPLVQEPQPSSAIPPTRMEGTIRGAAVGEGTYSCYSAECQSCKLMVLNGFAEDRHSNYSEIIEMKKSLFKGINQSLCQTQRARSDAKRKSEATKVSDPLSKEQLAKLVDILEVKTRRRRATIEKSDVLGITTKIGCNYKKGDEVISGWTGLCNLCWQWRKLPARYFPSLLNEVTCDSSDNGCLADFGTCRPVYRAVNVLKNVGTQENPMWEALSINSISACECQVELGTPLSSLVIR